MHSTRARKADHPMTDNDTDIDLDYPDEPLPVSVLTGFLGSGKTTLLRHLLAHPDMDQTAVIVNEFGEIGLDHLLVESAQEDTILLNSGCLCCTVRGDLVDTMRRLYKQRVKREIMPFKRLVIETTGLADPAPILHTLMNDPVLSSRFRLDGVVTTVDAANGSQTLDQHEESLKQAAVADRLLLTKADLVDDRARLDLEGRLASLNPAAPVLPVAHGAIDPSQLFGAGLYDPETKSLDVRRWLKAEAYASTDTDPHKHGHHDHDHAGPDHTGPNHAGHDVNRHDDRIRAFCLTYEKPMDWDRFNDWVEMLITFYGANILRIKGLLDVEGIEQPVAIHGVQHVFHPPVRLDAWPESLRDSPRQSQLVFIVRDLDPKMFDHTLHAFLEGGSPTGTAASSPPRA